jgi:hypothetical protein
MGRAEIPGYRDVLKIVRQWPPDQRVLLVREVLKSLPPKDKAALPKKEADLLLKINQGLTPEFQLRYNALTAKRQATTIGPDEYTELLSLSNQLEKLEASRLEALAELARLRKTTLRALMEELEIQPPAYV